MNLAYRIKQLDKCELCKTNEVMSTCIGCNKRICYECESGYYADVELCNECRKEITPEEYADDCRGKAEELAEECTCPEKLWTGSEINDSTCELTEEEHQFIAKWKTKVTA